MAKVVRVRGQMKQGRGSRTDEIHWIPLASGTFVFRKGVYAYRGSGSEGEVIEYENESQSHMHVGLQT